MLGRGRSNITYTETTATKVTNPWEPSFMRQHPLSFIPIHHVSANVRSDGPGQASFTMPLGREYDPQVDNFERVLRLGAEKLLLLWNTPAPGTAFWQQRLRRHLLQVLRNESLEDYWTDVKALTYRLNDPTDTRCVHGDATVANLICLGSDWHWIDPLQRDYVPNDPHVDLGKLYQSCWGYEAVLLDTPLPSVEASVQLMTDLANDLRLNVHQGLYWCVIHLIRLIPYQEETIKPVFITALRDLLRMVTFA